jgi:hypothetical protein
MGGMLTTLSDLGSTSARFSRRGRRATARGGADPAIVAARDAAGAASGAGVVSAQRHELNDRRLRLRPARLAELPVPDDRVARRRLPGFGTQMRWLPEYGVGLIAFGNLT